MPACGGIRGDGWVCVGVGKMEERRRFWGVGGGVGWRVGRAGPGGPAQAGGPAPRVRERRRFWGVGGRVEWRVRRAGPGGPAQAGGPAPRVQERSQFWGKRALFQWVAGEDRWSGRPGA